MDTLELTPEVAATCLGADQQEVVPVVLSGGAGTRLWPLSRESLPKQFLQLLSRRTMLQETILRGEGQEFGPPIIVCNQEHRFLVAEQLRETATPSAQIVVEPVGRNSAPAVTAAALLAMEVNPGAILCVMPADGAIGDVRALRRALATAAAAARVGGFVTLGVPPTRPETGYGYIELGRPFDATPGAFEISQFIEKPARELAARLIASGYLWNSGIFVFAAAKLRAELELHAPKVLQHVEDAVAAARRDGDFVWLNSVPFTACPAISLDHAVAEHTASGVVVPAEFSWNDIGSWSALWDVSTKDDDGNVTVGDVVLEGAENCYVRSSNQLTAVVGIKDAIVVATADAILVLHKNRSQDVGAIVEQLRASGRTEAKAHNRILRPWGYYESVASGERFQVKRILVNSGAELSLQKHFHRAEHWVVVEGSALVTQEDKEFLVTENQSVFLPLGCVHKIKNPGRIPLVFIEVQSGSYLGEDDIVRLEDSYGRA
jgi:mannose-1-phosphate guanylyltransferase / mannose-6-phosphate isomerase